MQGLVGTSIFALSALIGVGAFLYPLFLPATAYSAASNQGAPALTLLILVLTLAVLLLEAQGQKSSAKIVAALGVMVAATSVLRFIEVAIPGPGGFSPIFVPIIIAGYVFGPRFGFLMGTLTIFVSAMLTGGIGPWLPYQMFATGWVGLTAGLLPKIERPGLQLAMLTTFAFAWGIIYGMVMNMYFWPFMGAGSVSGSGIDETIIGTVTSFGTFYLVTSLIWDIARAFGSAVLMLALGLPAVRALERFRDRFYFQVAVQ